MTVFVTHAPADEAAATALETYLERRGVFAERQDGARGFRPLLRTDVAVVLYSRDVMFSTLRLQMERHALDAWTEGRLILVKLDHTIAPVGLRDLPAIEATFEPQRDIAWAAVAKAVQETQVAARKRESEQTAAPPAPPRSAPAPQSAPFPGAPPEEVSASPGASLWRWVITGVVVLGLALGSAAALSGVSLILLGVLVGVIALAALTAVAAVAAAGARQRYGSQRDVARKRAGGGARAPAAEAAPAPSPPAGHVFVSYARADGSQVEPLVAAISADGRQIWLDKQGIQAGEGWAGEIVRAIRVAERVMVMCSKAAFESDHVKREVYLADKHRRPLTPVFLEDAQPPEDFEYFFAGVQHLNLYETPADERSAALARALSAA
jgi:hypothetical protein